MGLADGAAAEQGVRWRFGAAEFDEATQELRVAGQGVEIERKPLELLACLLRNAGEVVTKEELLDAVWPGRVVVDGVLSVAVSKLRSALGEAGTATVATVHGYGYRLTGPVERLAAASVAPLSIELKEGEAVPRRENWTLQRRLGRHGDVWLAQHAKTREQRVFKFSADGARLAGLKREATLSRLLRDVLGERPEFVRVLEWNFEAAPYFIECEYGGESLDQWADAQGGLSSVPLDVRLELMAKIADAVGAAHAAGVLHKDMKPANVLAGKSPTGDCLPRLTDFGSGHLLDPQQLSRLGITRLGFTQTAMDADGGGTPLYAAPEVIAGRSPSAQSDIYALGVMLYQFVVGDFRRPLAPGWETEIDDELLRDDIAAAAAGATERRLASAAELATRLRTLVARRSTLHAERDMRQRAEAAEAEVRLARARRPWLIGAVVSLVLGLFVSLFFFHASTRARDAAAAQAETAAAINNFLKDDLLAAANPQRAGRAGVTVAEAVEVAATQMAARFADRPATAAPLYLTLGQAFNILASFDRAEQYLRDAIGRYAALGASPSLDELVARLALVDVLARNSKMDLAAAELQRAAALEQRLDSAVARALYLQRAGMLAYFDSRYADAIADLDQALEQSRRALAADPRAFAMQPHLASDVRRTLAMAYALGGKPEIGEKIDRELVAEARELYGPDHFVMLNLQFNLAFTLIRQARYEDAGVLLADVAARALKALGPTHNLTLQVRNQQAFVLAMQHRTAEAATLEKEIYEIEKATFGADHQATLETLNDYGESLMELGRYAEAARAFDDGLQSARRMFGDEHGLSENLRYKLVDALLADGRADEAAPLLNGLSQGKLADFSPNNNYGAALAYQRGRLAYLQRRRGVAIEQLQQALRGWESADPNNDRRRIADAKRLLRLLAG